MSKIDILVDTLEKLKEKQYLHRQEEHQWHSIQRHIDNIEQALDEIHRICKG